MPSQPNLFVMQCVRDAVSRLPGVSMADATAAHVSPLKGLSNLNFLVTLPHRSVVVRIAQPGTGSYANRSDEIAACHLAHEIGLGPALLLADRATGLLVQEYISQAHPPGLEGAPALPASLARMATALGSLHRCGRTLPGRYDVFAVIANYRAQLLRKGCALPAWPPALIAALSATQSTLAARALVPCHNDPVPENFLFAGPRTWLVDWEYAGMNDPAFDLAYLSLEADLSPDSEHTLLAAHGDAEMLGPLLPRYKFLICVMSALWGRLHAPGAGWEAWTLRREGMAAEFAA